jgi:hypothetical protein
MEVHMAILGGGLKGNILTGLAVGIGVAVLGPVIIPAAARVAKPFAKAAIKGGVSFYEKGREVMAEAMEVVEDLVAEAKSELAEADKRRTAAASAMAPAKEGNG